MITIKNLSKTFETAEGTVEALNDINLTINDGDIYGIIGMSGAGKSTLVRCINMLERPTSGTVDIDGSAPVLLISAFRCVLRACRALMLKSVRASCLSL